MRLNLAMGKRGERSKAVTEHPMLKVVAENVETALGGRSSEQIAKLAEVGRKSVDRLRQGRNPTLGTFFAVADALAIKPERLLVRKHTDAATQDPKLAKLPEYPSMLGSPGDPARKKKPVVRKSRAR